MLMLRGGGQDFTTGGNCPPKPPRSYATRWGVSLVNEANLQNWMFRKLLLIFAFSPKLCVFYIEKWDKEGPQIHTFRGRESRNFKTCVTRPCPTFGFLAWLEVLLEPAPRTMTQACSARTTG